MDVKRCEVMIKPESKDKFRAGGSGARNNRKKEQGVCWDEGRAARER